MRRECVGVWLYVFGCDWTKLSITLIDLVKIYLMSETLIKWQKHTTHTQWTAKTQAQAQSKWWQTMKGQAHHKSHKLFKHNISLAMIPLL